MFKSVPFRNSSETCEILFWQEAQKGIVLQDGGLVGAEAGNAGEERVN